MFLVIFLQIFLICFAWSEAGKVTQMLGAETAYLIRDSERIDIKTNTEIEQGDEINSEDSVLTFLIYPTGQYRLSKKSTIKITQSFIQDSNEVEKSFSVIEFVKGVIRAQVVRDDDLEIDHQIRAKDVAFAIRGTEFEVSQDGDDYDLDVVEGEVEVSSPHIQTFVPEIVKANEGFRFNRKARSFKRRQFKLKNPDRPAFWAREVIKKERREKRLKRRQFKTSRQPKLNSMDRARLRAERKEQRQASGVQGKRRERMERRRQQR